MNATRAATIRLRSSLRRRGLARPRADADAGDHRPARGGDPRLRPREVLAGRRDVRRRRASRSYEGRFHAGAKPRLATEEEAAAIVDAVRGGRGTITKLETTRAQGARAAAVRPHLAAARGQHPLRLQRPPHARGRAALLRGAQGADLSAHGVALPDQRHGRGDQADRRSRRRRRGVREGRRVRHVARPAAARPRRRRRQGRRSPRDHPHQLPPRPVEDELATTGASTTSSPAASWPSSTPRPSSRTRGWRPRSLSTSSARAARSSSSRAGAACTASSATGSPTTRTRAATRRCPSSSRTRRSTPARSPSRRRRPSRRAATPTRRCWARWRPRASSSTTTSCARR